MARFQILKGSTSTWSTLRNQLVYFRTTCFYNPVKYCILLSFHINIKFLNVFQTSPFCPYRVPDIATWSYQTRVFHLLITSWHIFPVHSFTLAPFFAFSLIRLSYINKSFATRMSYLLPCAKFQRVTFFMKRSYLLPRENFKLSLWTLYRKGYTPSMSCIYQNTFDMESLNSRNGILEI